MNRKYMWILPLVTIAVVLPAKWYAAFNLVDQESGFYRDGGRFVCIAAAFALAGIVAAFLLTHKEAKLPRPFTPFRSVGSGVLAALCGVSVAVQSLVGLVGWQFADGQALGGTTVMDSIFAAGGFLAAVSFLMAAYDFASGVTTLRRHPLAALLSSVWGCIGLIALFVDYAAVANRFENIYHTFTVAFLLLFLFSQAEYLSGVDRKGGAAQFVPYGFGAIILAVTDSLPNLALMFAGRKTLGTFPAGLYFVNLVIAAYIAVYLSAFRKQERPEMLAAAPVPAAKLRGGDEQAPQKREESGAVLDDCLRFLEGAYPGGEHFEERPGHPAFPSEKTES